MAAERMFGKIQGLATSWLYRQPNEEKVHFAYQDSTELANLGHLEAGAISKDGTGGQMENGQPPAVNGGLPGPGTPTGSGSATPVSRNYGEGNNENIVRKPISAWDAGWNVTNAIQVIIH